MAEEDLVSLGVPVLVAVIVRDDDGVCVGDLVEDTDGSIDSEAVRDLVGD